MPLWVVQPDHAGRLHISYFELLDWIESGGSLLYRRFRQAWQIMDRAAADARRDQQAREVERNWRREGFKGGEAEDDSAYFEAEDGIEEAG